MRTVAVLLSGFLLPALAAAGDMLGKVGSVYVFPMQGGFDQYLANRISSENIFQVVTDPKRADAVLTDRLGPDFEQRIADLYPAPEPAPAKEDPEKGKDEPAAEAAPARSPERPFSTFGRGKGTLFLVDPRGKQVLWSTYEKPQTLQADDLDRTASRVTARLKRDLKRK